jgi:hypothetical protein
VEAVIKAGEAHREYPDTVSRHPAEYGERIKYRSTTPNIDKL